MLISNMNPEKLMKEQITKLVFGDASEMDNGTLHGDCIFVFGGMNVDRVLKAVELYKNGRAPLILFTGGDRFGQRTLHESIFMRDEAIKLGVPAESILIEQVSNHTKENILASLMVLDRAVGLEKINRLLLVSAPGHMRRCLLMLKTFMPPWYEYVWCPDDRKLGQANSWWTDTTEEKRVRDELYKVIYGVKGKYFEDAEVDI
ncbi:YdcF family protein [Paenibacillus sp. N3/727]|uniref:YdcF family protein n=1 Tax=Paenibacillus sp. N3/727 TaxID=2925845 RepID=UPI001F52CB16|nr:YdcF family protein [Paenibacillus sp. N3/727]UNK20306.1 YdcF family protein [Paenibacillus sp. N3/727]